MAALGKEGFAIVRIKGSHHFLKHPDGRKTVVPVHSGETIGPGLLLKILRACEIDLEQLDKLLR
ncbi:MAG TPA: type II toxin-antitoxin system HicA family toxin [Bryobacteraceae bacterium]|nr:type II toxin-antitoxin system HicA family toxin [Bryobacteraceae bacterium]